MDVTRSVFKLIRAGQGGIVLTTVEPDYCIGELRTAAAAKDAAWLEFYTWGMADGLIDKNGNPFALPSAAAAAGLFGQGADVAKANVHWQRFSLNEVLDWLLKRIHDEILEDQQAKANGKTRPKTAVTILLRNADRYLSGENLNLMLLSQLQQMVVKGTEVGFSVILQTAPGFTVPVELAEYCEFVEHDLPDEEERTEILILQAGVKDVHITPEVRAATAGLSGAKTVQFVAEAFGGTPRRIDTAEVFRRKASFLGKNAKLDVWSPQFQSEIKLRPTAEAPNLEDATEVVLLSERTALSDEKIAEGDVVAKIRFLSRADKQRHTVELPVMAKTEFERIYRPFRNEYSFESVVGLQGVKDLLRNAMRPGVPDRARMRHLLLLGVPGVGKSMLQRCASGEFNMPLTAMQSANLYSKWLGDTDKALYWMLKTVSQIGGILGIDEFQRFLPTGNNSENGTENRVLGTLLTWLNDQNSNLVLSAANNVSKLPDEVTRSGRIDALIFVGFPGREAKDAAWAMYRAKHELPADYTQPKDEHWTPADIQSCCRLSEMQQVSLEDAARWITPSYRKNKTQMDELMRWAAAAGCICAETGKPFSVEASLDHGASNGVAVSRPLKTKTRRIMPEADDAASMN